MYIVRTKTEAFPFYSYEKAIEFKSEDDSLEWVVVDDPAEIEKFL
jgi:hypothetical protein